MKKLYAIKFCRPCPKVLFITFLLMGSASFSFGQINETLFYDTLTKISHEGKVNSGISDGPYMYLEGSSFSATLPTATLTKVDTSGKVIWTATPHDSYDHSLAVTTWGYRLDNCKSTFKSGNRLYTIASGYSSPDDYTEIWCISDSSGEVLWRSPTIIHKGVKIVDYSPTELLLLSWKYSGDTLKYRILDKATGKITFTKNLEITANFYEQNRPEIIVDDHQNILIASNDTCKKYSDKYLTQLKWKSWIHPSGALRMIDKILQDSARYIFIGNSYARAVDSATGNTLWDRVVPVGYMPPLQSVQGGRPKAQFIKDSLLYITWTSATVGGLNFYRGFTLTRINTRVGTIGVNASYDITGVPADPVVPSEEDMDWPMAMSMDNNDNIYLAGSYDYDSGPENPCNWGIMKINGKTGAKIFEGSITLDSTNRMRQSQGRFLHYFNGKLYCAGNVEKSYNSFKSWPLLVSFDTTSSYQERFRVFLDYTYRYTSSLAGLKSFSNQKIALLKKLGQSGVVEMRDINNNLIWNKYFSSSNKYVEPQNFKTLADTGIAASFIIYAKGSDTTNPTIRGLPDSILFVGLDSNGVIKYQRKLKLNGTDTTLSYQVYSDKAGKTNFLNLVKTTGSNAVFGIGGYMLNSTAAVMGGLAGSQFKNLKEVPQIRLNQVQHYNGDTLVSYRSDEIGQPSRNTGYLYSATQSASGTYNYYGTKTIKDFAKIYSVIKLDSASFFITGKSETGTIIGARFNRLFTNSWVWSRISSYAGKMLNADTSSTSIYCVSEKNNNILYLSKINKLSSVQSWDFERAPQANKSTNALDLKYNNLGQNFTVAGYLHDSLSESPNNTYFYITLDSSGNIVKDVTRDGTCVGETRINTLEILQNGFNAYGGSLATSEFGTVGFYNADCSNANITPLVSIGASSTTICLGSSVTFTASPVNGGPSPTYQWQVNGVNAGTNSNTFTTTTLNNNDQVKVTLTSNANCLLTPTATSNIITMTVSGAAVIPTVSINPSTISICSAVPVTFTATPTNEGATPGYQWQVNGVNAGTNSSTFTSSTLNNNDQVKVILTSSLACATPTTATSNVVTMTVTPGTNASAGNDTTICSGTSAQLHGAGGNTYIWTPAAGLNNPNIANPVATPASTTVYILTVSNSGNCISKDTMSVIVNQSAAASVTISSSGSNICSGTSVTFTALSAGGGSTPVYQWKVNGANAGTSSNTFTSSTLQNNDQVKVVMASSLPCVAPQTATSNIITMTVTPGTAAHAGADTSICAGTSAILHGSGGTDFSWSPTTGLNAPNISSPVASPVSTTVYILTVSNAGNCPTKDTVVVNVSQGYVPTVNISTANNTICLGSGAAFIATPTNGGSSPAYQWKVNGVNTGTNSNTFASSSLQNNDQVTVVLTSSLSCVLNSNTTSNTIVMNVQQLAIPVVSVNDSVLTVTNPAAGATYTWQVKTNGNWINVIPLATGINYTTHLPGEYRVKGTKGLCTQYSLPVTNLVSPTSHFIYLRPNPATQMIRLDSIRLEKKYETVEIADMTGKRVLPIVNIANQISVTIDVSTLNSGSYMAIIRQKDGTYSALKFVKL